MNPALLLFDFDGTLYDTVPANCAAYNAAMAPYGVQVSQDQYARQCNGRYYKHFLSELLGPDPGVVEAVHNAKLALYPQFYPRIRENAALFGLMAALRPRCRVALVSTASRPSVVPVLERFGRMGCFDLILTQEDAPVKKPAPDCYLLAMARLGVGPDQTLIFEDSQDGIAAAKASGAACLVVPEIK